MQGWRGLENSYAREASARKEFWAASSKPQQANGITGDNAQTKQLTLSNLVLYSSSPATVQLRFTKLLDVPTHVSC